MKTQLTIPQITGLVHLGCSVQERKIAQTVFLGIEIEFKKTPLACTTDQLKDTPCYAEMTEIILKSFNKKHYATIEHLCKNCFVDLKKYLKKFKFLKKAKLRLVLTKKAPPVQAITAGSQFSIEEKL